MRNRVVVNLLNRAAAALKSPMHLSFDAKQYLISELLEMANELAETQEEKETGFEPDSGELLKIFYKCPKCDYEWHEFWTSACDATCPGCGLGDITASSYEPVVRDDEGAEQ